MEYNRAILIEVLVYHWATNTSGCGCGWRELGKSHPEHVVNIYEASIKIREQKNIGDIVMDKKTYTEEQVAEFDRCARAYGWEIGNGQPITAKLETTKGNPFMNPNWRITYGVEK